MKAPALLSKELDLSGELEDQLLSGEATESKKNGVDRCKEFLMMKLGYSEPLASAASGWIPPLD